MSQYVDDKFKQATAQASRLLMTEQAYFASVALGDALAKCKVAEFQVVAWSDAATSKGCMDLDGSHFPMEHFKVGFTAPPFHPWCRSYIIPFYQTPLGQNTPNNQMLKDMNFETWKKTFVKQ